MHNNIAETITKIIAEIAFIDVGEIDAADTLTALGIDSLKTVELMVQLEDRFGIVFQDSDLNPETLNTVQSIIELVEKYV